MFTVESGIPIPAGQGSNQKKVYPFGLMKPGDSFAVQNIRKHTQSAVLCAAKKFVTKHGGEFVSRKVVENGQHFVRVWRVS